MIIKDIEDARNLIREKMKNAGISQAKFALQNKIPASNLSNFIAGTKNPSLASFIKICGAFSLSIDIKFTNEQTIKNLYSQGLSIKQIVQITDTSQSKVYSNLSQLKKQGVIKKRSQAALEEFLILVNSGKNSKEICEIQKISVFTYYLRLKTLRKNGSILEKSKYGNQRLLLDSKREEILSMISQGFNKYEIAKLTKIDESIIKSSNFIKWLKKTKNL